MRRSWSQLCIARAKNIIFHLKTCCRPTTR